MNSRQFVALTEAQADQGDKVGLAFRAVRRAAADLAKSAKQGYEMDLAVLFPASAAANRRLHAVALEMLDALSQPTTTREMFADLIDKKCRAVAEVEQALAEEEAAGFEGAVQRTGSVQVGFGPNGPIYYTPNLN